MVFDKKNVDYSLYLVTDSSMLPSGASLQSQVEAALQNGATLVQLREKDCETKVFIENALAVKKLCTKYDVPLIINDRVDVALAIGADGVHVGQDDMPVPMVRKLLGPDKIIGLSVGYVHEVEELAKWGEDYVDYIGIGMVFPTDTKKNPKKVPMGTRGVARILDALEEQQAFWCKSVLIGGLHPNNIPRVLLQSLSSNGKRAANGIAVVSEIMASEDAAGSTKRLKGFLDEGKYIFTTGSFESDPEFSNDAIREHLAWLKAHKPLVHHITNHVHKNFGANITLALGASPIMSEECSEFMELARIPHAALVLNTGTVPAFEVAVTALEVYNEAKRPIVFDPVGFSASAFRRSLNERLLGRGQLTCIKGNIGEILGIAGASQVKMRGVDSENSASLADVVDSAQLVAFYYRTIVVVTGEKDIIVDGSNLCTFSLGQGMGIHYKRLPVYTVSAGNLPLMGSVTATGCSLGSTIASFVGAIEESQSVYHAVISAVAVYKAAGKLASDRCHGSGTFMITLIDSLYQLSQTGQMVDELVQIERFN